MQLEINHTLEVVYGNVYLLMLLVLWNCNYLKIGKIIFREHHFFSFSGLFAQP